MVKTTSERRSLRLALGLGLTALAALALWYGTGPLPAPAAWAAPLGAFLAGQAMLESALWSALGPGATA